MKATQNSPADIVLTENEAIGSPADARVVDADAPNVTLIGLLRAAFKFLSSGRYTAPNGKSIRASTTLDSLFSDDFGGAVIDPSVWDVIDGGLPLIAQGVPVAIGVLQDQPTPTFSQAAIGSGTAGITHAVAASALTVSMGTTNGAERWFLSRKTFCGKEDVLVILSKSQAIAANSVFVGLVEVDATGIPLLNANFAADFTNRGGCEFGKTVVGTSFQAEAVADSSPSAAIGIVGVAGAAMTTSQEYLIEIDSRDIIVSNAAVDSVAAKSTGASRVSSQCPNDQKLYKLLMRFKNVAAPGSNTNVVIQRVLVVDNYEQRVQVSSAEGDTIGAKAMAVNVANSPSVSLAASSANIGYVTGLLGYTESSTPLSAGATFTGTSRSLASRDWASYFNAFAYADQAGTLYIEMSVDTGANWRVVKSVAVAAGVSQALQTPVFGGLGTATLYRERFVNGATAQAAFTAASSFTGA